MRKNYHHSPKLFLLAFLFLIAFSNCSKKNRCHSATVPHSLVFLLEKEGKRLPDSVLNNVKISYYENGKKLFVNDVERGTNVDSINAYDLGIVGTRLIGNISSDHNIKDYLIEYPDGDVDTLFVDYLPPSQETDCLYVLKLVKYNGEVVEPDPAYYRYAKVYLFKKR